MFNRQQVSSVIDKIILDETDTELVEKETVSGYKELNDKCDVVISKIKNRKAKKQGKK